MKGITIGCPNTKGIKMNVAWYIPAGVIETIYWLVAVVVIYRLNRDLHRNIHEKDTYYYVKSEFVNWQGWVKIDKH